MHPAFRRYNPAVGSNAIHLGSSQAQQVALPCYGWELTCAKSPMLSGD
jgi:hypothetical protein